MKIRKLAIIVCAAILVTGCGAAKEAKSDRQAVIEAVTEQDTQNKTETVEVEKSEKATEVATEAKAEQTETEETQEQESIVEDPCANGHDFSEATCTKDAVCSRCGEVKEKALSHVPSAKMCLTDTVCTRCGEVLEAAKDHDFAAATCTQPATCKVCKATQGEPLGHDYQSSQWRQYINYTCSRCYDSYQELYLTDEILAQYASRVVELVNVERANNGLGALSADAGLMNVAKVRAGECVTSFSHTRPNGADCFSAFSECGVSYSYAAENIAAGQFSPEEVVNSWMNSPGHRANILNPNLNRIGVGAVYVDSGYGIYWSQNFTD